MKKTIIIFLLLLTGIDTYAQSAHWTCDDHAFEYSMTAYIQIQSGDALIDNLEDFEVATFCGDECRGVATVLDNPNCYYLRLRSNSTDGETMVVKCYSRSRNIEYPATATILFTADQLYNYPSSPLVIDLGALDAMVNVPIDGNGSVTGAGEHYTHTTVTLTATPDYGYHFEGWIEGEDTLSVDTAYEFTLTANRTIAAHFAPNVHNVRFVANDIEFQSDNLAFGSPIVPPTQVSITGHTFKGWQDVPAAMPDSDIVIIGTFTPNRYALIYIVDGEEVKSDSITYATDITPLPEPVKEGHTFSGWSEIPATMPSRDVTVTGSFTVNSYILRYYVDGEAYDSISVTYGEAIVPIAEPTRVGYTFSGWIGVPETMPAHDVNVAGTFATDMYLVTFIIDGDVLKADSVTFGLPIEAPTPEREGYTFSGWSEIPSTMPAHDVTITGSFAINSYKLTYIVDGEEYKADSVTYATTLAPLSEPTKEGYTFSGWSEIPVTMPAHDVSIIGTFKVNPTHETEDAVLAYDEEKGGYEFTGIKEPENKETTVPREVNGIPVVSVPEGTFAGNTQMQVLTWDSEAYVDAKCFDEPEEHGNLLVFVSSDANVTFEGNVIRCIQTSDSTTRYEAEKITLYDGRPMTNPVPFTAKNISITKDFSKETIIGSTSGWETIVVPFDVDSITTEDGQLIAPFGSDANTDKHFWLANMDEYAGFTNDKIIHANIPYIISMPNSEQYIEEYRITGKVTFHGRNVVVQPTADAISNAGPLFGLVPTYQEVAAADSVFVLNDEPYEADGITWPAGSVFVRSIRAARPFEAYTYANASNGGNVKGYIRLDEMATGIKGINQWSMVNGQWSIANGAGAVYDLSGRRIAGSGSLKKGLYIESGQKVLVK